MCCINVLVSFLVWSFVNQVKVKRLFQRIHLQSCQVHKWLNLRMKRNSTLEFQKRNKKKRYKVLELYNLVNDQLLLCIHPLDKILNWTRFCSGRVNVFSPVTIIFDWKWVLLKNTRCNDSMLYLNLLSVTIGPDALMTLMIIGLNIRIFSSHLTFTTPDLDY